MMSVRPVAFVVVVALVAGGPLAPLAAAQQPAQTEQPAPQAGKPPAPAVSAATEERELRRSFRQGIDLYDVIAFDMTIAGAPLKAAVCVLGVMVGNILFLISFGSADRASAAVMREGCDQNWWVTGKDIRPNSTP